MGTHISSWDVEELHGFSALHVSVFFYRAARESFLGTIRCPELPVTGVCTGGGA